MECRKWFVGAEIRLSWSFASDAAACRSCAIFARALQKWLFVFLVVVGWEYDELRLTASALLECEQHALDDHFIEAHRHELFVGAGAQRDPFANAGDSELAERASGAGNRGRPLR